MIFLDPFHKGDLAFGETFAFKFVDLELSGHGFGNLVFYFESSEKWCAFKRK